jgi:hypothetical protein
MESVKRQLAHLSPEQRRSWLAARVTAKSDGKLVRLRLSGPGDVKPILDAAIGHLTGLASADTVNKEARRAELEERRAEHQVRMDRLRRDRFRRDFCGDCSAAESKVLAASEVPINFSAFGTAITGTPAWRQHPAWYQISSHDRVINPSAQRVMARRMDPSGRRTITLRSSHGSLVSHSRQVAAFIERAAR